MTEDLQIPDWETRRRQEQDAHDQSIHALVVGALAGVPVDSFDTTYEFRLDPNVAVPGRFGGDAKLLCHAVTVTVRSYPGGRQVDDRDGFVEVKAHGRPMTREGEVDKRSNRITWTSLPDSLAMPLVLQAMTLTHEPGTRSAG